MILVATLKHAEPSSRLAGRRFSPGERIGFPLPTVPFRTRQTRPELVGGSLALSTTNPWVSRRFTGRKRDESRSRCP